MPYFRISKFFLIISVLFVALVTGSTLFPFIVGKYVWFRTTIDLALIFFLLGLLFDNQRQSAINQRLSALWRQPLVIAVSVFVFIFLLAGFFGIDPAASFWSSFERGEGGFQLIHLWLFFILLLVLFREEKDWQKILVASLIAGLLMGFYGVGAALKYTDAEFTIKKAPGIEYEIVLTGKGGPLFRTFKQYIGSPFNQPGFRFSGSIGNPAYVAAYAIFMIFYVLYLLSTTYRDRLKSWQAFLLYVVGVAFLAMLWSAATRGAFLGFLAAVLVFAGYYLYSRKSRRKWFFLGLALVILAVSTLVYFQNSKFVRSLPGSRVFDLSFAAKTFQDRMIMWKIAIDGWKERPLFGWGPENYIHVFARHFNPKYYVPGQPYGAWFDRAHSIYFDYLVETGALGILSFLAIFVAFYWLLFKYARINTNKERIYTENQYKSAKIRMNPRLQNPREPVLPNALIFTLPVAYLVQGMVLFDVLPIYVNLFLFLALANYQLNLKSQK